MINAVSFYMVVLQMCYQKASSVQYYSFIWQKLSGTKNFFLASANWNIRSNVLENEVWTKKETYLIVWGQMYEALLS